MAAIQDQFMVDVMPRDGYPSLDGHLLSVRPEPEWRTTFGEWEAIRVNRLLVLTRWQRPLRSNPKADTDYNRAPVQQVVAWSIRDADRRRVFNLDRDFPPWDPGPWPEGLTVSREQMYDGTGRLTGGLEDISGDGR